MFLFISNSYTSTVDLLCHLCGECGYPFFRFNTDYWDRYQFHFEDGSFYISDPLGRKCTSSEIDYAVFYKWNLRIGEYTAGKGVDSNWIASTINNIIGNLVSFFHRQQKMRLFTAQEALFPKVLQMHLGGKYWPTPKWSIDFGHDLPAVEVMVKQLSSRGYNGKCLDVKKVNAVDLSSEFPWFIQEPAKGNRDATVLYINGKVHCYQFATDRGALTDWRVTQGTSANKWEVWQAGEEFEKQVRSYMGDIGLKFGRLDFIIGGEKAEFLEVNPCGQFGWLDDEEHSLHREILDAIMDSSSVIDW